MNKIRKIVAGVLISVMLIALSIGAYAVTAGPEPTAYGNITGHLDIWTNSLKFVSADTVCPRPDRIAATLLIREPQYGDILYGPVTNTAYGGASIVGSSAASGDFSTVLADGIHEVDGEYGMWVLYTQTIG